MEILIDAHALYNVPTAMRLATRLAPYNITWFEEPVPPESYDALPRCATRCRPASASASACTPASSSSPIFERRLADFVMPDVTWTGGISELKKIATMAEAYYIPISPHDASGPINVLAGAHVMMTVPNFYRLETRRARPWTSTTPSSTRRWTCATASSTLSGRPGLGLSSTSTTCAPTPCPASPARDDP